MRRFKSESAHEQDPTLVLSILSTLLSALGDRKTPKLYGYESATEVSENPNLLDKLLANMVVFVITGGWLDKWGPQERRPLLKWCIVKRATSKSASL